MDDAVAVRRREGPRHVHHHAMNSGMSIGGDWRRMAIVERDAREQLHDHEERAVLGLADVDDLDDVRVVDPGRDLGLEQEAPRRLGRLARPAGCMNLIANSRSVKTFVADHTDAIPPSRCGGSGGTSPRWSDLTGARSEPAMPAGPTTRRGRWGLRAYTLRSRDDADGHLARGHSSVDHQRMPGQETCSVAGQVQCAAGDFGRCCVAAMGVRASMCCRSSSFLGWRWRGGCR